MKRRKIQIGLIVLVLLMCCGINPKAWATTYEWDGAVWTIASTTTEVDLSNVTSADQLTIRNNGARLNTAGLKTTVAPNIYFALNNGDAITLDVPAGYSALGTVTGATGGQYILKAFNPTLALGNVSVSGGWLRLKHNTGGSGAGTITTPQLWADNGGTIYVDTMSCVIGGAATTAAAETAFAVVAANGGNVTFTIGNSANLMNIKGSVVTGASTAALTLSSTAVAYNASGGVSVSLAAGVGFTAHTATAATTAYGSTIPTGLPAVNMLAPTGTATTPIGNNTPTALSSTAFSHTGATTHQWYARAYKATFPRNYVGPLSSTPGTVNVIGTGTAAGSPNSDPSFIVLGKIYLNRFLSGTETRTYTHNGTAYEIWDVPGTGNGVDYPGGTDGATNTKLLATVLDLTNNESGNWDDNENSAFWTLASTVRSGTVSLNDITDVDTRATDHGSFTCTNAALYVGIAIESGINLTNSGASDPPGIASGTGKGKLDLRGTEVHLGSEGIGLHTEPGTASTFSALPADSVITDENTSLIFYTNVTDFPLSSTTAGRHLGSLYFKLLDDDGGAQSTVTLDTTGQVSTSLNAKLACMGLVGSNITLHGNLEIANIAGASLNLLAFGKGTITVNGYVDLGNTAHHVVAPGLNLVFNGAIRGWGLDALSGDAGIAATNNAVKALTDVTDVIAKTAGDIGIATAKIGTDILLPNITIGVNGMENGDSVTALPNAFSAVGNLTINRAACDLTFLGNLTVVGNLTINAGGLTAGAAEEDVVGLLRVIGDTRIERNGYLNLDVPEIAADGDPVIVGAHHRLGTHHTVSNSLTVNGLLSFEGFNPVDTLTVNGPIQPSQGALQANAHTMLILNGKTSYSLPATVTELLTLNYNIDALTANPQVNTLTLQADLEVDTLTNTTGILTLAGYKLTVNDVNTIDSTATIVGVINAVNGSALELDATGAGLKEHAYGVIRLDETTDLTIKNFGWYVPATAAPGTLFRVNNLTVIDDKEDTDVEGTVAQGPMGGTNGAALIIAAAVADGTATNTAGHIVTAEIMGNLNIINNGKVATDFATVGASSGAANAIKNLTVHGDVVVTNNSTAFTAYAPATYPTGAVLWTDLTNFTTYGQVTLGGTTMAGALFSTDEATTLNILGEAKRFEFPAKDASYHIGKLVLNRPAGARFNNMKNVFAANGETAPAGNAFIHYFGTATAGDETLVIELQNGDLNLNGNNITFANAVDYLQETPGNYVVNTGTSYFSLDVHMPVDNTGATYEAAANPPNLTRGAILAFFGATPATGPTTKQMESIGITGVSVLNTRTALTTAAADAQYFAAGATVANYARPVSQVRRYPKGTLIPDVGISAQRYYYINHTNAAKSIAATYDLTEVVGTENTMKFYIETVENVSPTSDAFSNAEELLGTTQISPSSTAVAGKISSQNFTAGKSYNASNGQLATSPKGYLFALASRPGGGGYKVWTGAVDSMWQVAGNWGPTPGAPGPLDQAIINRSTDTIVITGTATCADLMINGDDILIKGRALTAGANAILRTTGNIYNYGHSSIKGVDGNNRLDLQVNDPTNPIPTGVLTTVVSATESGDPNGNTGVWFDNVTVTTATLLPSDGMRISGNISLTGNSTMQQAPGQRVVLYGPNTTPKTLTVPMGNAAVFGDIVLTNQANMTTASSLMLKGKFDFEDAVSAWESTDGIITATYASISSRTGTLIGNTPGQDASGGGAPTTAVDSNVTLSYTPQVVWHNPGNARFIVNNIQIGANLPTTASEPNASVGYADDSEPTSYDPALAFSGTNTLTHRWGGYANPIGTITIAGTLDKIGTSTLEPMRTPYVSGGNGNYAVIFSSNRQTEISNGAGSVLRIPNLIVTPNTKLRTTSSFNISNHLEVQTNAEMLCNSGTVTFDGPTEMTIINVSDRTLVMNNMNVEGRVTTPSSWKLAGNLIVNSSTTTPDGGTVVQGTNLTESYFEQTAGTITIQNGGQNRRLVDNMASAANPIPNITFNKLALDATSRLTTGPQDGGAVAVNEYNSSFVIMNRAANGTMASGIELAAGSGLFTQPIQGTVYFQTDGAILDTTAKWITNNNTPERMQFGNIFIAPEYAGNNVRTKSSFEVLGYDAAGIYDAEFLVAGGGANFEALEGTITFVGDTENEGTATISSLAPSKAQFANLRSNNMVTLKIADQSEIFVSENLIADGTSQFVAGTTGTPARVELNGKTAAQHLTGTTTEAIPFSFTSLLINKGQAPSSNYATAPYSDSTGVVVLDKNAQIITGSAGNQSELILSRGVLNLKNNALTVGANYITYQPGYSAIDGAEGRYIIAAGHETKKLEDPMFTIAGSPTLYNLDVTVDHQLANSLTVNNDLTLSNGILSLAPAGVAEVVEPKTLTLYGDLIQSGVASKLASGSKTPAYVPAGGYTDNTLTRLILKGTGTVQGGLRDDLFKDGTVFSITVARGESLGGDLTMDIVNGANLTIQTGVNTLNLGTNTLTLSDKTPTANSNGITIVSGNLTAADATVDFRNLTVVPANIFARSEVGSINFGTAGVTPDPGNHPEKVEIRGNVRVINALTIAGHPAANDIFRIYTGNNKLTLLTPSPALNATHYVVGNLVMPVGNLNEAVFHVGSPAGYSPVTLRMGQGTAASFTPEILVTALNVDPTAGRGGNANNSINQTWTILPQVEFTDSLSAEFTFPGFTEAELGITVKANQFFSGNTFAAKWEEGHWRDYRTVINVLAPAATAADLNEVSGLLNRYPVVGSAALTGDWAIFAANANTDAAKNDAIAINKNKIVITELPTPVTTGISFAMTIALQDQYNQPVITANDLPVLVEFTNGGLVFAESDNGAGGREAIIPAGQSTVEVTLQVDNSKPLSNSPVAQIKVSATGTESTNWTPAISNYFPVIPTEPSNQAFDLTFTRATYTDVKVTWTNGDGENVIIVAKANGSLVIPDEMPRNGVTYVPNMVYGAGSNIGDAVVLYNGPSNGNQVKQSIDVAGLIPSTTYTLYAFAYNGTRGEESYNTSAAQRNPNSFSTSDGDDDDIAFGGRPHSNDSIVVSSTVGTNAPITGNVVDGSDYDCFNFTVTDEAPNVRVLLTNVPGDYTLELYDFTGRRIRRSTLLNESDEALVVNNLPAGTFVVKVFPVAANAETGEYKLLINTFSSEIFSVTPAPNMR